MVIPFDVLVSDILRAGPDIHFYTILRFFLFLYGISGSGGVSAKGKRKPRQEEDEDYREFPQKKHKLYGKGVTLLILFSLGAWALFFEGERPYGLALKALLSPWNFLARHGLHPALFYPPPVMI